MESEQDDSAVNHEQPLAEFSEGDEIVVSARDTPMTVDNVKERISGYRVIEASNHHGRYVLKGYEDGDVGLWASAQFDSMVEVEHAE